MSINKRIVWIDYLKAFTCFLVALGHLMQSFQSAGITDNLTLSQFVIFYIYLFHMPLFMCISGYLYNKKSKKMSKNEYKRFELKKLMNLMIPYITFYLVYLGINILFSKEVNTPRGMDELIGILNNPMSPYWFLYALMSIFIVTTVLENVLNRNKLNVFIFYSILKIISIFYVPQIYFIKSIMMYGIYFYLGCFIYDKRILSKKISVLMIIIDFICAIVLFKYSKILNIYIYNFFTVFMAILGIIILVEIFKSIQKSKVLDTFKEYTFQIFLMHTIFAAGVRIVLLKIGITNYFIHFVLGISASIYIPVLVSKLSNKILYTEFFFFPVKTIEEIKERKIENVRKKT